MLGNKGEVLVFMLRPRIQWLFQWLFHQCLLLDLVKSSTHEIMSSLKQVNLMAVCHPCDELSRLEYYNRGRNWRLEIRIQPHPK